MKIYTFLILSFLINSINAQPFGKASSNQRISKLLYENSSGEKGTTIFLYDVDNKLTKALWSLDDGSRYSNNFYEYDKNGNLISAFRDFSDSLTSFERFEYDSVGNKIAEYFNRSDGVSGYSIYKYSDVKLIKAEYHNHKGWLSGIIKYLYDDIEKLEYAKLFKDNEIIAEITYNYDSDGNLIQEHWDFNRRWSQTFKYIYDYKNRNKHYYSSPYIINIDKYRISKEEYTYNGEAGGPSHYHYSNNELLHEKEFIRSDGLTTNTTYKYDNEGKLFNSFRKYSDGKSVMFTYSYDENNHIIHRECFKLDSLIGYEYYLYDQDGELQKAYLNNFDGWLNGTITFKNNELGFVESGVFRGVDGFDALISFKYNTDLLLTDIRWDFSFGKYQIYSYEYFLPAN